MNFDDSDDNPLRYCGEYFDKATGTIYLRARYYSPVTGRFTQLDPIRDGLNWYAYCGNNPVRFVDATGEAPTLAFVFGGALIGGLIGAAFQIWTNETDSAVVKYLNDYTAVVAIQTDN